MRGKTEVVWSCTEERLLLLLCIYYAPRHSVHNKVNIKISNYAQQLRTLLKLIKYIQHKTQSCKRISKTRVA